MHRQPLPAKDVKKQQKGKKVTHAKKRNKFLPRPSLQDFYNYILAFQNAHNEGNLALIMQLIRARCDLNFEHTSYRMNMETKEVDETTRIRNVGVKAYIEYLERLSKLIPDGVTTVGKPEIVPHHQSRCYIVQFPYVFKGTLLLIDPTKKDESPTTASLSEDKPLDMVSKDKNKPSFNTDIDFITLFLQESEMLPVDDDNICFDDDLLEDDSSDEVLPAAPVLRSENLAVMTFEEITQKVSAVFPFNDDLINKSKQEEEPEIPATGLEFIGKLNIYVHHRQHKIIKMEYVYK